MGRWKSTMAPHDRREVTGSAPTERTRADGSALNDAFHDAYDDAKPPVNAAPVLAVLRDTLVLFYRRRRERHTFAPTSFHAIKAVAHAPVAAVAILTRAEREALGPSARAALDRLHAHCVEARSRSAMPRTGGDVGAPRTIDATFAREVADDVDRCLADTTRFLAIARDGAIVDLVETARFAREMGPVLLRLTDHATRIQLEALHARFETIVREMTDEEQATLEVIVTGDHQARQRSLAMQYFQKRLGEHDGSEARVTYGEGITTEDEALVLAGTRRLDRAVAAAFFGDARRLQRDVLGDAAEEHLARLEAKPIGEESAPPRSPQSSARGSRLSGP